MHVTCVHVYVKKEFADAFIEATMENHKGSVCEPGNLRFDILQSPEDDPYRFMLYEAWESDQAAADHKKTAHYLKWKDTVAGWMAKPREGVRYEILCPRDKNRWVAK